MSGALYFFALATALGLCVIGGMRCRHCEYEIE